MFFRVFPWQNRTETTQTIGGLKMYQGIFIDDQEADKDFALLMSTPGKKGLTVKFQQPTELMTLANHIVESPPAFVVLNYRQQMPYAYKAEPLAQLLRSYSSENVTQDFPIVLLSHEEDITGFLNNVTAHNLFDCLFTKQEVAGDPEHRQKMLSLVKGYRRMIKKWHKKSERWATFFGLRWWLIKLFWNWINSKRPIRLPSRFCTM